MCHSRIVPVNARLDTMRYNQNGMNIPQPTNVIPQVTTEQMIEVDRLMIDVYGITLLQMMENAGRNLAHLARVRFFAEEVRGKSIVILAGRGGNGGGTLVAARHLHNAGAQVRVVLSHAPNTFTGVPAHQLRILQKMGTPVLAPGRINVDIPTCDLILDGLIGYSLKGAPQGSAADLIRWANAQDAPTLSLDVPSGLNTGSGVVHEPAMRATATMTLALPKVGLLAPENQPWVGECYLADISVPPELYAHPSLGLTVGNLFAHGPLLRL